jgi:hypothetical protein
MTEAEFKQAFISKIDYIGEKLDTIAIDVAVLKEKTNHAVDETKIIKAIEEHLSKCPAAAQMSQPPQLGNIKDPVLRGVIYLVIAAASAFGGSQLM